MERQQPFLQIPLDSRTEMEEYEEWLRRKKEFESEIEKDEQEKRVVIIDL